MRHALVTVTVLHMARMLVGNAVSWLQRLLRLVTTS